MKMVMPLQEFLGGGGPWQNRLASFAFFASFASFSTAAAPFIDACVSPAGRKLDAAVSQLSTSCFSEPSAIRQRNRLDRSKATCRLLHSSGSTLGSQDSVSAPRTSN